MVIYSAKRAKRETAKKVSAKKVSAKICLSLNDRVKKITMLKFNYDGELAW